MTQNDNFKYYYGQSLINDDTVSEYESILDYIVTHGGSNSGIDADKLDGHDSSDFLLIEDSDAYIQPGFYIGYTAIENYLSEALQFLEGRDVKLTNEEYTYMFDDKIEQLYSTLFPDDMGSILTTELNKVKTYYDGDWDNDHRDRLLNAGLCDLELALTGILKYVDANNDKLNQDIDELENLTLTEEQKSQIDYILDNYLVNYRIYDNEGNLTDNTEAVLDAGAVNGLRFFLVTQQQYDQYPDGIKEDPRYIFIIKDEVPEGYVTPTTISASSFKPLFKTDGYDILVSVDGGATYNYGGNLYQLRPSDDGFLSMHDGNGDTFVNILADPTVLNDNFFINGAWMRDFLSADPSTANSLNDIIDSRTAGLRSQIDTITERIENLDESYELQENKLTDELTNSTTQYPSSYVVMESVEDLKSQIRALEAKLGEIDTILTNILGTGTD